MIIPSCLLRYWAFRSARCRRGFRPEEVVKEKRGCTWSTSTYGTHTTNQCLVALVPFPPGRNAQSNARDRLHSDSPASIALDLLLLCLPHTPAGVPPSCRSGQLGPSLCKTSSSASQLASFPSSHPHLTPLPASFLPSFFRPPPYFCDFVSIYFPLTLIGQWSCL
ncbi:hypothetical protein N7468_006932 [Penicillium chermesinum]|uniref:Uncharacterized protein n=1 Tax=Penicillium chermesinum TaxID=63820 RepID=A0A9W9TK26_9EURO|nr:uncharacterized protein N7468_006932 [Penicillium chermesinum]KAJ5225707.1 hypothetical protein N7468_006932 [Penicillium chermesinum]KAJ6161075.1 hypothetical protein N7470_004471 [Penicillium chermesinum]